MQIRTLNGIQVSVLGLGTSRLASMGSGRSKKDAARLLDAASGLGVNLIDTADTYGSTAAERWLGDLTAPHPDRFVIVTKSGLATADLPPPFSAFNQPLKKAIQKARPLPRFEPQRLRRSIDRSLRRLRRERVEFYLLHLPPFGITERSDVFDVLRSAVTAGKIGSYGVSTADLDLIKSLHPNHGVRCVQTMVNPLTSQPLATSVEQVTSLELIANHAMAPALLSASSRQTRSPAAAQADKVLRARLETSPLNRAQLLLRHAAAVPRVKVVLSGTSSVSHLMLNAAALAEPTTPRDLLS